MTIANLKDMIGTRRKTDEVKQMSLPAPLVMSALSCTTTTPPDTRRQTGI